MPKKILVVDDDEGILEAFQAMLESSGYVVITTPDAEYVTTLTQEIFPDLILLDVLLSGKDGREICKQLKSNTKTKDIPVIMVSAHPSATESILQAGAYDYMAKPFEMNELLKKIAKHLT